MVGFMKSSSNLRGTYTQTIANAHRKYYVRPENELSLPFFQFSVSEVTKYVASKSKRR